jgi:hypothetical protein
LQGTCLPSGNVKSIEADLHLAIWRKICVQGGESAFLNRDSRDGDDFACDLAAGGNNELIECVHRLRNFPANWLADFAEAHFLIQYDWKRRAFGNG